MSIDTYFLNQYLHIELTRLFMDTSETLEVCEKRLETVGLSIGEKLTEKFHALSVSPP